jgi:hypothetical protein
MLGERPNTPPRAYSGGRSRSMGPTKSKSRPTMLITVASISSPRRP